MSLKLMLTTSYFLAFLATSALDASAQDTLPEVNGNKFYYFGYGSNMLTDRIRIQNPTAVKLGKGELKNWKLDFIGFTERWDGAPATIVPITNATVLGTLWEIDLINLPDIDNQEGVNEGIYYATSLPILWNDVNLLIARTYVTVEQPTTPLSALKREDIPFNRQPSKTYIQCLVKGAMETVLPSWYVEELKSIKNNGRVALGLEQLLNLKDVELND